MALSPEFNGVDVVNCKVCPFIFMCLLDENITSLSIK